MALLRVHRGFVVDRRPNRGRTSLLLIGLLAWCPALFAQPPEVVSEVRIQGNVATPDDEILRLAGVTIGMPVGPDTVSTVADRLRTTRRFDRVEVLKRYASIADPSRIVLVLLIDEGPVSIEKTGDPSRPTRVVRKRRPNLLFLPVLSGEDGYGVTYGVRIATPDAVGPDSRLSFPATWGGEKRLGAEIEKRFAQGPVTRIEGGGSISRKTNPFFQADDDREALWIRGERELTPSLRIGASTRMQEVSFLGATDRVVQAGADAVVDTRLDPWLARNAVYVRAAWDHLAFQRGEGSNRFQIDAQGHAGVFGQAILVGRVLRDGADGPLPDYLKPIFGGQANVRGFRAGTAVGDTLMAGSLELRWPLTSPLRIGKMGVSGFVDAGTVYDNGAHLGDRRLERGVGGGVWFAATFLRLNVVLAHGVGASTRVHVAGNVTF
jgi:Omp85 superfamily domain